MIQVQRVKAGEVIYEKGKLGDRIFIIQSGKIALKVCWLQFSALEVLSAVLHRMRRRRSSQSTSRNRAACRSACSDNQASIAL